MLVGCGGNDQEYYYYMKTGRGSVEEVLWLKEWSHLTAAGVVLTLYSVNRIFTSFKLLV